MNDLLLSLFAVLVLGSVFVTVGILIVVCYVIDCITKR